MPDLLLELRSEEIPARMQRKAAGDLRKLVTDALVEAGLTYEAAREYWTPRRLALDIRGLTARSKDISEEIKGPSTKAPEQAIQGFLRKAGLSSVEEAHVHSDPKKGEFYVAHLVKPGRSAEAIVAEIMPGIVRGFPWPKSMRWGKASAKPGSLRWVRPLQSILCLFGPEMGDTEVVRFEIDGVASGDVTYGHRFHAPEAITVRRFDDYVSKLEAAKVVLDADRRKAIIRDDAKNLAFAAGLDLVEDDALLEEVSGLVEWPVVLVGEFGEAFLEIPPEVIRLTIRANQKCFVARPSGSDGGLANRILLTANIEASDGGAEIVHGNGKVVRARLSDALYFWKTDQADLPDIGQLAASAEKFGLDLTKPLDQRMARLDSLGVTFHAKLGTQGERVERIARLAEELALTVGADPALAWRAALLAKADLTTEIVGEFPELQGAMGRKYAELQGEDASVAAAIEEHYKPQGPSDRVPTDPVSIAVALADKLDTLVGFWAIDEKPTGSKDPYALRRAALGVIRIVVENGLSISLAAIFGEAHPRVYQRIDFGFRLLTRNKEGIFQYPEFWRSVSWSWPVTTDAGEEIWPVSQFEFDPQDDIWVHSDAILPPPKGDAEPNELLFQVLTSGDGTTMDRRPQLEAASFRIISAGTTSRELLAFFHDRLKVYLREKGARHDLIDAVLAAGERWRESPPSALPGISPARGEISWPQARASDRTPGDFSPAPAEASAQRAAASEKNDDLLSITSRVVALGVFLDSEDGRNLSAGAKRAANILAAEEKKGTRIAEAVDPALFRLPQEGELFAAVNQAENEAGQAIGSQDFSAAMVALSALRAPVDAFFDAVLVNDEDEAVRANRLALLARIRKATGEVADFSKIAG